MNEPSTSCVLSNGIAMPLVGLGTFFCQQFHYQYKLEVQKSKLITNEPHVFLGTTHSGGYYHDVVVYALRDCGYRMIDTARRYGVESNLGIAWKACNLILCLNFLVGIESAPRRALPLLEIMAH